jgi:hypothetical protein
MSAWVRPRTGSVPAQRRAPRTPAPAGPAGPAAQLDGLGQLTALVGDGVRGLRTTHRSPRRAAIWGLWLFGTVVDAWTTTVLLRDDRFVEGNPGAAVGMGVLGVTGYTVLASLICVVMAVVSTGRPAGPVARCFVAFFLLVAVGKAWTAVHNLLLWRAAAG